MATGSSISPPASRCARPGTRIRRSCAPCSRRPREFLHISSDYWHERMTALAERLAALAPMREPVMSFLCQSGTESVEAAIKLARYVTGRPRFIGFLGGFHGRTMGSLSFTSSKYTQQAGFAPTMPGVMHVPYPNTYRPLFAGRRPGPGGARLHPDAVRAQSAAAGSGRDPGRASAGRRRLPGAAGGFPRRAARALRRARHPADLRRGAVRRRPHRPDVRRGARRRRARHHDARQGPGLRAADRRDGREAPHHGAVEAWRARQHLRRQSARLRRGDCDARSRQRRHGRERRRRRHALHGPAARAGPGVPLHRRRARSRAS